MGRRPSICTAGNEPAGPLVRCASDGRARLGWPSEVEPLAVVGAELPQQFDGGLVFDPLGDCGLAEAAGYLDDGLDGEAIDRVGREVLDELALDLSESHLRCLR